MLFNNTITVIRILPGTRVKGIWTEGKKEYFSNVICSVQPINGRDVYTLPEGEREKVMFKVYFKEPIELYLEDKIEYLGVDYKITKDNVWSDAPFLKHSKVLISRLGD